MAKLKRPTPRKLRAISARTEASKPKRTARSRIPSAATLDPDDPVAVEAFAKNAIRAAKRATAKAVADLYAAGIPVAVSDGNGGVILKRSPNTGATATLNSRRRA